MAGHHTCAPCAAAKNRAKGMEPGGMQ